MPGRHCQRREGRRGRSGRSPGKCDGTRGINDMEKKAVESTKPAGGTVLRGWVTTDAVVLFGVAFAVSRQLSGLPRGVEHHRRPRSPQDRGSRLPGKPSARSIGMGVSAVRFTDNRTLQLVNPLRITLRVPFDKNLNPRPNAPQAKVVCPRATNF